MCFKKSAEFWSNDQEALSQPLKMTSAFYRVAIFKEHKLKESVHFDELTLTIQTN